jgi:hypothetical protein
VNLNLSGLDTISSKQGQSMSVFRDRSFWASYGKFGVAAMLGFGGASLLGVPLDVTVRLAAGAIIGFPGAYSLGLRRPPNQTSTPHPAGGRVTS